jgi:hypothetical protein
MNSLRSALTAVLAGPTQPKMQAKGGFESRLYTSDILSIELVQNIGQLKFVSPKFRLRAKSEPRKRVPCWANTL